MPRCLVEMVRKNEANKLTKKSYITVVAKEQEKILNSMDASIKNGLFECEVAEIKHHKIIVPRLETIGYTVKLIKCDALGSNGLIINWED